MQKLRDVMSTDVKILNPEMTLEDAAQQMRDGNFGSMPVGENDRLIGVLSDRDIAIRAVAKGYAGSTKVREVMSESLTWAYENDSVEQAAELMSQRQIRRLPVVNQDKRLVGIVALGDLAVGTNASGEVNQALKGISQPGR
ncbi:MAG TPA: CBS domain-containing protein [Pusillimonas sp.]|jgi:CBS domain-containing protein|nr:CBS domain-containing protein [Pusillimonas sp.]|tara:strand:- start:54813 stop:55235 length:423 start_codon:yes stop_codon:yes gene_type:complete